MNALLIKAMVGLLTSAFKNNAKLFTRHHICFNTRRHKQCYKK